MDFIRKIAEDKIESAMKDGQFDNLYYKGKPIDLDRYFQLPPHLRMTYELLKNSGFLPPEISLKKNIEELKEELHNCQNRNDRLILSRLINEKTTELNILIEHYNRRRGT